MLWAIAIILALLWALGLATANFMGGYVHVLLALSALLFLAAAFRAGLLFGRRRAVGKSDPPPPRGAP